jgi:hypothetical protein
MQIQVQQGQIFKCLNKIVLVQYTIGTYGTYDCKYLITDEIPYGTVSKVMQTLNAYFLKGGGGISQIQSHFNNCELQIQDLETETSCTCNVGPRISLFLCMGRRVPD